ncbi:MAG: tRNA-uridine aminocarboxypropyltransferase [Verrucomicrobiota bacterium]
MNLCLHCRRRLATCVCDHLRPFTTRSRFVILMHPKEFKKEKVGTGRFSHLILENSEMIVGVDLDQSQQLRKCFDDQVYQTVVLYPGDNSIDLSRDESASFFSEKPIQFIVIDGTWQCAKKMMRLTTKLHTFPRVSFAPGRVSEFQVKHQPRPECLSTAESIHQVLLDLNRLGIEQTGGREENLMDVFRQTVRQQIEFANDSSRQAYRHNPPKNPSQRKLSKRWDNWPLFFKEADETIGSRSSSTLPSLHDQT